MMTLRRIVGAEHLHLGAVDHDVGDLKVAQVEHAAEHVGVVTPDGALLRLQIDGAADLLVRGEDVGLVVLGRRREGQDPADDDLDRAREGSEQNNDHSA